MAYEKEPMVCNSHYANVDLSTHQYKAVAMDNDGEVGLAVAASTFAGVLANAPEDNARAKVIWHGITKVRLPGTTGDHNAGTKFTLAAAGALTTTIAVGGVARCILLEKTPQGNLGTVFWGINETKHA